MVSAEALREAESRAVWSLVLGILDFVVCPVLCLWALSMGNAALAVLERPDVDSSYRTMATAGRVLGIIGLVLLLVQAAVMFVMFGGIVGGVFAGHP